MALEKRHSISIFVIKFLWILFLVFQECNLVICDGLEDDSLKKALEAIERRQRDLEFQENDYYGQPENIGYGFQKTLGFFDNSGPASDLGSFDSGPKSDPDLQNVLPPYDDPDFDSTLIDKRKTNFRERMSIPRKNQNDHYLISQRDTDDDDSTGGLEYLQLLKNLWAKYRQSHPDDVTIEDLTDDQVEDILNALYDKEYEDDGSFEVVPVRSRKNYRVFDGFGGRSKRYPSFGEGIYGKRNQLTYQPGPENDFLYSLKYINPELNREAVENLKEGLDFLGDERDADIARILNGRRREEEESGYDDSWLPGPVDLFGRNEKRELVPRVFKQHNGIRLPVKRSTIRVRKAAEKESKEVKKIFGGETTVAPPKKNTKKPTDVAKKNATKPEVTKHHEGKKLVRRSEKYTKEEILPNSEIADIFSGEKSKSKKSIDWSQYFGLDKRSGWLRNDHLRRTEQHLMAPKRKRFNETPFDTRHFSRKRLSTDIDSNIDRVEDKIGDIEERIIDDAVKYTGAHSDGEGENLGEVKSKVIQRLEAAYSLEKMKNALEEFKNLIKPTKNSEVTRKASTEVPRTEARTTVPKESSNLEKPLSEKAVGEVRKKMATKKEGVKAIFGQESPSEGVEFLNDLYSPSKEYDNEGCPVLERILHNCLRVEEMGGRFAELLVPLCSLQQICYFCGPEIGFSKTSTCDAVYLSEARNICQGDSDCLVSARNSMLALQDLFEQDFFTGNGRRLPSDSCLANPCIQRYFLSAPGAIYPLEVQRK